MTRSTTGRPEGREEESVTGIIRRPALRRSQPGCTSRNCGRGQASVRPEGATPRKVQTNGPPWNTQELRERPWARIDHCRTNHAPGEPAHRPGRGSRSMNNRRSTAAGPLRRRTRAAPADLNYCLLPQRTEAHAPRGSLLRHCEALHPCFNRQHANVLEKTRCVRYCTDGAGSSTPYSTALTPRSLNH